MKRFKNILLVINDKVTNEVAIQKCIHLCMHNQARLTVIEVLEEFNNSTLFFGRDRASDVLEAHLKKKKDSLNALLEPYRKDIEMDVIVGRGKVFFEIIRAVLHHNFDLVVKTCHQQTSLKAMLFGTTDMHLLRKCPCPVWLIKPQDEIKCQSILAAVDIEPSIEIEKMDALNQQILEMATSLALSEQAELHIVHAWMVFGEDLLQSAHSEHLEEEVSAWMKDQINDIKAGLNEFEAKLNKTLDENGSDSLHPEVHILEGDAYEIIPRLAEEIKVDLVIMGTIVRTGLPGFFMGNTAESILNQLNCSVLAIKPKGFVSPVTI